MHFNLVVVAPKGYPGIRAFDDIVVGIEAALRRLGHDVVVSRNNLSARRINILFGGHLLGAHHHAQLPERTIVYNLEQLASNSAVMRPEFRALLAARPVWDYCSANLEWLAREIPGVRATLCPVGFVPELKRIGSDRNCDIDALFYGDMNDRRERILHSLIRAGIEVRVVLNCFGAERDKLIARSKLVLNLHATDARIFEIVRVSYLLANARAVVSEIGPGTEIDADLRDAVAGGPADQLPKIARDLIDDDAARESLAERGHRIFAARDGVALVREALAHTSFDAPRFD